MPRIKYISRSAPVWEHIRQHSSTVYWSKTMWLKNIYLAMHLLLGLRCWDVYQPGTDSYGGVWTYLLHVSCAPMVSWLITIFSLNANTPHQYGVTSVKASSRDLPLICTLQLLSSIEALFLLARRPSSNSFSNQPSMLYGVRETRGSLLQSPQMPLVSVTL